MTNHNEVRKVPSDAEIIAWASEEQFFLFCDQDELLDIVRATIAKYGAPLAPLTLSLSPDPRGVHVAVHQGSECVHAEAMALPGAVWQGVPDTEKLAHAVTVFDKLWVDGGTRTECIHAAVLSITTSPTAPDGEGQEPVPKCIRCGHFGHSGGKCGGRSSHPGPLYAHPAPQAAQTPLDEAIEAGNGTLHGAVDYWQERALKAEAGTLINEGTRVQPAQDEREAFEREIGRRGYVMSLAPRQTQLGGIIEPRQYQQPSVQIAWEFWQARAALSTPAGDALDAAFEAVRRRLCELPRFNFVLDDDGVVRRVQGLAGEWIEFDDAQMLFDPVAVDAAIASMGKGPTCEN